MRFLASFSFHCESYCVEVHWAQLSMLVVVPGRLHIFIEPFSLREVEFRLEADVPHLVSVGEDIFFFDVPYGLTFGLHHFVCVFLSAT